MNFSSVNFSDFYPKTQDLNSSFTIWDAIFISLYYLGSKNLFQRYSFSTLKWYQIEDLIRAMLFSDDYHKFPISFTDIRNTFSDFFDKQTHVWADRVGNQFIETFLSTMILRSPQFQATKTDYERRLLDFFYSQLDVFEKTFSEYVYEQEKKPEYFGKAKSLLKSLSLGDVYPFVDSFNFSKPQGILGVWRNIHGISGKNAKVVFGIGANVGKDPIKSDDQRYLFTKEYQESFITPISTVPPSSHIRNLCIYGHSLGPEDRDYFLNLFHSLEIGKRENSPNVSLFYSLYDGKTVQKVKEDMVSGFTKLLEEYDARESNPSTINQLHYSGKLKYILID